MADDTADARPPVWVGHVVLATTDVPRAYEFWSAVGMRPIERGDGFGVLELRGGTHLVLVSSDAPVSGGTPCSFDLMVEDLEAARARYEELGFEPGTVEHSDIHDSFTLVDPSGYVVTVNSSHVSDRPV